MERYIFNTKELASYIASEYKRKTGKEISPIKLQKTLYFCFAYWGGFILKGKDKESEMDVSGYSPYLFEEDFEAWVYGPVVRSLYKTDTVKLETNNKPKFETEEEQRAKDLIDSLIDNVIEMSDFSLVDLAHKDKSWKNKFNYSSEYHNEIMDKESIIKEYATK